MRASKSSILNLQFLILLLALFIFSQQAFTAILDTDNFEGPGYESGTCGSTPCWTETVGTGNTLDEDYPMQTDTNGDNPNGGFTECLRSYVPTTGNAYTKWSYGSDITEYFQKFYVYIKNVTIASGVESTIVRNRNGAATITSSEFNIKNDAGVYKFRFKYYNTGLVSSTLDYAFTFNKWYRIEINYDATNKDYEVRIYDVAGTLLNSASGTFTGTATNGGSSFVGLSFQGEIFFDQFVMDNSTWVGDGNELSNISKMTLKPNGNYYIDWGNETNGCTNNGYGSYTKINDSNDSTYNCLNGDQVVVLGDWFNMEDPSSVQGNILNVRHYIRMAEHPGGTKVAREIRSRINTNGSPYLGSGRTFSIPDAANFYYDWEYNPSTKKAWTWNEIANLITGYYSPDTSTHENWHTGGKITEMWVEVFYGSKNHRLNSPPIVAGGAVSTGATGNSSIKFMVRTARPPFRFSKNSWVKIKYSATLANMSNACGTDPVCTSSVQVSSLSDWTTIINISGLNANTIYYFDVLTSGDNSNWRSAKTDLGYSSYWSYQTLPIQGQDTDIDIAVGEEPDHGASNAFASLAAKNPRTFMNTGDWFSVSPQELIPYREGYRATESGEILQFRNNILDKTIIFSGWDDHDMSVDNGNKTSSSKFAALQALYEYKPLPDLPSNNKKTGTTTSASAGKLINSSGSFASSNLHVDALAKNTSKGHWSKVTAIDSSIQLSVTSILIPWATNTPYGTGDYVMPTTSNGYVYKVTIPGISGSTEPTWPTTPGNTVVDNEVTWTCEHIFSSGDNYELYQGVWFTFWIGNAQFWVLDLRYFRDVNGTANGDMMDATGDGGGSGTDHIQRDWLHSSIEASSAKFKIILSSVVFNGSVTTAIRESWGGYDDNDAQRTWMVNNIPITDTTGFISGNFHIAALDNGTYSNFKEAVCGPISSGNHDCGGNWGTWSDGCYVEETDPYRHYFGIHEIRSETMTLKIYNSAGTLIDEMTLGSLPALISFSAITSLANSGNLDYISSLSFPSIASLDDTGVYDAYPVLSFPASVGMIDVSQYDAYPVLSFPASVNYETPGGKLYQGDMSFPANVSIEGISIAEMASALALSAISTLEEQGIITIDTSLLFSSAISQTNINYVDWSVLLTLSSQVSYINSVPGVNMNPVLVLSAITQLISNSSDIYFADLGLSSAVGISNIASIISEEILTLTAQGDINNAAILFAYGGLALQAMTQMDESSNQIFSQVILDLLAQVTQSAMVPSGTIDVDIAFSALAGLVEAGGLNISSGLTLSASADISQIASIIVEGMINLITQGNIEAASQLAGYAALLLSGQTSYQNISDVSMNTEMTLSAIAGLIKSGSLDIPVELTLPASAGIVNLLSGVIRQGIVDLVAQGSIDTASELAAYGGLLLNAISQSDMSSNQIFSNVPLILEAITQAVLYGDTGALEKIIKSIFKMTMPGLGMVHISPGLNSIHGKPGITFEMKK